MELPADQIGAADLGHQDQHMQLYKPHYTPTLKARRSISRMLQYQIPLKALGGHPASKTISQKLKRREVSPLL